MWDVCKRYEVAMEVKLQDAISLERMVTSHCLRSLFITLQNHFTASSVCS